MTAPKNMEKTMRPGKKKEEEKEETDEILGRVLWICKWGEVEVKKMLYLKKLTFFSVRLPARLTTTSIGLRLVNGEK